MSNDRVMSSKAAIFSNKQENQPDSEKLLDLYWNRAELKKAYAEAQDEQFRLKKIIDEHKGSAARLEQKLEHLESLLVDPEWVHNVTVHYQLRALNKRCAARLANFAEHLKQQREKRNHKKLLDTWNSKRSGKAAEVEAKLGKVRLKTQQCEEQMLDEQTRLQSMNVFSRLFKRKAVNEKVDALAETTAKLNVAEHGLLEQLERLQQSSPPGQQGLDTAAKRSINFMILAFAQQLYLLFDDDNLASLVRESADKSVGAIQYGAKEDCDRILSEISKRWNAFDNILDFADTLQQRSRILAEKALFMKDDDVVPVAGTVALLIAINESGGVTTRNASLLGENYWGITNVLSR